MKLTPKNSFLKSIRQEQFLNFFNNFQAQIKLETIFIDIMRRSSFFVKFEAFSLKLLLAYSFIKNEFRFLESKCKQTQKQSSMTVYLLTFQPICEIIISFFSFTHQDMNMPGLSTIQHHFRQNVDGQKLLDHKTLVFYFARLWEKTFKKYYRSSQLYNVFCGFIIRCLNTPRNFSLP